MQQKGENTNIGKRFRITGDFSAQPLKGRKAWSEVFLGSPTPKKIVNPNFGILQS